MITRDYISEKSTKALHSVEAVNRILYRAKYELTDEEIKAVKEHLQQAQGFIETALEKIDGNL